MVLKRLGILLKDISFKGSRDKDFSIQSFDNFLLLLMLGAILPNNYGIYPYYYKRLIKSNVRLLILLLFVFDDKLLLLLESAKIMLIS